MGTLDNIKQKLDEFVEAGGNVNELSSNDPIYKYVKDAKIKIDGRTLSTEEKFEYAGHNRPRKISASVEDDLVCGIEQYRIAGGDFNIDYQDLPFIAEARKVIRTHKERTGQTMTVQDCLRKYGAKEVSHIYKRYIKVMDIEVYKNNKGYVDSYRKDPEFCNYISKVSEGLDMLDGVVVSLIGNQNLERCYIDADYINYVKKQLAERSENFEYTEGLENLRKLSKEDRSLYNKLEHISTNIMTENGEKIGNKEIIDYFDLDAERTSFRDAKAAQSFENYFLMSINHLKSLAYGNGGIIKREDIPDKMYKAIKIKSQRLGVYVKDLFKTYEIDYVDGINKSRFAKVQVDEVPFIKEMRKERDKLYLNYLNNNPEDPKEIKFENYFTICVDVYEKYRESILNVGLIESQKIEENNECK